MKYSIRYSLLPTPRSDGSHTVRLRVSWNGQRITHYCDHSVLPADWDTTTGSPRHPRSPIRRELDRLTSAVNDLFDLAHLEKRIPTTNEIKAVLGDKTKDVDTTPTHSVLKAINAFILEQGAANEWSDGTAARFRVLRSHLKKWNSRCTVEEMDEEHLRSFIGHLYAVGLINSTVAKFVSQLRWFLRWCHSKGWTSNDDWNTFRPKFKGTGEKVVVYLTEDELTRLQELDLTTDKCLSQVRDVFLFCCFTGLRYSDVAKLEWSDISTDYVNVVTKKTSDILRIDLNKFSRSILEKYRPTDGSTPSGRVLPVISNQKMNDYLKELAKKAEINEPIRKVYYIKGVRHEVVKPKCDLISTHCGRRTFVVLALSLGISPQLVMKWTGHNDYKAMQPYVDIATKAKKEAMAKFDTL